MKRIVIIGAGIIGCALAHELKTTSNEVYVLEKNPSFGQGVTSRNSGVIHSGLYYRPGSLKATLCIEGQKRLYHWCAEKKIAHRKTGKFILAQDDQESHLENLYQNAISSGVLKKNLHFLSSSELKQKSSYLRASQALHVLESGIVDPHHFCQSLYTTSLSKGCEFSFHVTVQEILKKESYEIQTLRGMMEADIVINAAGLYADEISNCAGITKYKIYPYRGDYFNLNSPVPLPALVYPVVKKGGSGLGVHVTSDLQNNFRLGPDAERIQSKEDFQDRPEKKDVFFQAAKKMLPWIKPDMISYDSCGIRPKLKGPDDTEEKDFVISEDSPGFVNLIGIESPGLTSALAISKYVFDLLK
ncbi:MAG: hypothetical protein A3B70_00070 [Deltaproteobacteria bacterium RIFCSPHIGHO2_02_FULL_40_11]|nr:MAG: hypothetical protein A3B70_00070 [Deltaproteobacteria bacterium RIFCSPHIGHO2_02_FULL_40_11]